MRGYDLPDHSPRAGTMEAVAMLQALLKEAPDHPGVHHYVIHAWEGSSFAKDAWPSCERYAQLVTNIPHALHMPGHIYSQTGKFAEAEKSFGDARENELGYIKADALYGSGHHGHNTHYLSTAYAFDGQYEKAKEAARGLLEFKENPRELAQVDGNFSAYRQGWFALMRAMVLAQSWMNFWTANRCRCTIGHANRLGGTGPWASRTRRRAMPRPLWRKRIRWMRSSSNTKKWSSGNRRLSW